MENTGQNTQIDLGHWLLRLAALIIDGIIVGIIGLILVIFLLVPFVLVGVFVGTFAAVGYAAFVFLIIGILMVFYYLYAEVNWGGTLGKRLLGLRVQTVKGGKITYSQSIIRNLSKIFWPLLILDWLIGILTQGDKRQKYSDRIAGTIVVQSSQPFASITTPPPAPNP